MRLLGAKDGIRVTTDKKAVSDYITEIILKRVGGHQSFLDLSKCVNLSPRCISRRAILECPHLIYLDVSYTRCDDLSAIYNLQQLRGLNVAGLQLLSTDLKGIEKLIILEALCLRNTNITNISNLLFLECIRSLDLGYTQITVYGEALRRKNRLEELLLDHCMISASVTDLCEQIMDLENIKLLNLHEGSLESSGESIVVSIPHTIFLEPYPRRYEYSHSN